MFVFNNLLAAESVDPERAFLLRHQDARMKRGQTLYRLWRYQPDEFRRYECVQSKKRFGIGDFVASFVVDPILLQNSILRGFSMSANSKSGHFWFRFWLMPMRGLLFALLLRHAA